MIQTGTLKFLQNLKNNNNREWFQEHKGQFDIAFANMTEVSSAILDKLKKSDPGLASLEVKKCMFRIYRDVRFSKDKSPYKINFGASFASGGRNSPFAGYYIHLQPGNETFVGGGIYMPQPEILKAVRQEIAYNTMEFLQIINKKKFKTTYGDLWGEKTKNMPREYSKDHPSGELLKYKHYVFGADIKDKDVLSPDFEGKAVDMLKTLVPFIQFLNRAVAEVKSK